MEVFYEDLTPTQKKKLCNGAGKEGLQGWLVPDFVFKEAANRHDFDYWKGCNEDDRFGADRLFLGNMLDAAEYKDIKTKKKRFILCRMFYRRMAIRYYAAVMELGDNPVMGGFHYAQKQRKRYDLIKQFGEL
jgi:hypothetical protein